MKVHPIRLKGPWKYEWLSPDPPCDQSGRVTLPADWRELFGNASGRVRFTRTFHSPTNLEPTTRLNLLFEGIGGEAAIRLNGQELEADRGDDGIRCQVTQPLLPTNELEVEVEFDPATSEAPGGLWGVVVLEIWE